MYTTRSSGRARFLLIGMAGCLLVGAGAVATMFVLHQRNPTARATAPAASATAASATAPAPAASATAPAARATAPAPAARATVAVDASSDLGRLQTQLSTNLIWAGQVSGVPNGQANLSRLAPPIVRIHAGDDGTTPPTAPEQVKGQWDFSASDELVNNVRAYGGRPLLNIKFAPDWQWTCSNPDTGQAGQVRDQSYREFAQYMARIVAYYNTGAMTDENGTVHTNPAGTANRIDYWELWNEPDGAWETPCVPPASLDPGGEALTPDQYVTMWNAVAPAMRAVDPTIKLVGPATANPTTGHTPDYVPDLLARATIPPDVISFHGYGGWSNSQTDQEILQGSANTEGLDGIVRDYATIKGWDTINAPIWLSEGNVNADWGVDPHQRPANQYGVAYIASEFAQFAYTGLGLIHNYDFIDSPQYGDISDQDGSLRLVYWADDLLMHQFPPGSTLLSATSSLTPGLSVLAIKKANGDVVVLLANRQPDSRNSVGGPGVGGTMMVTLSNFTPAHVTLHRVDATTSATTGPATVTEATSTTQRVTFGGYGMAVLTFSGTATAPPTLTAPAAGTTTSTNAAALVAMPPPYLTCRPWRQAPRLGPLPANQRLTSAATFSRLVARPPATVYDSPPRSRPAARQLG
jgi:hypothetical protein